VPWPSFSARGGGTSGGSGREGGGGEDAPPTPADRPTVTGCGGGGNDSRSGHTGLSVAAPSAGSGNGGRAGDGGHAASAPCHDAGGRPCPSRTAAAFPPPAAGGRPPQRGPRRPRRQRRRGGVGARGGPHLRTGRVHRGPLVGPLAPPFPRGDTGGRRGGRPRRRRSAPPRCSAVSMDTLKSIKKHPWLASIRSNVDPNPSAGAPPGAGNAPVAVSRARASAALLRRSLCRPTSPPRGTFLRPCSHQLLRPWESNRAWGCSSLRRGPVARSSKEGFAAGATACSAPPIGKKNSRAAPTLTGPCVCAAWASPAAAPPLASCARGRAVAHNTVSAPPRPPRADERQPPEAAPSPTHKLPLPTVRGPASFGRARPPRDADARSTYGRPHPDAQGNTRRQVRGHARDAQPRRGRPTRRRKGRGGGTLRRRAPPHRRRWRRRGARAGEGAVTRYCRRRHRRRRHRRRAAATVPRRRRPPPPRRRRRRRRAVAAPARCARHPAFTAAPSSTPAIGPPRRSASCTAPRIALRGVWTGGGCPPRRRR